jgi:exodeoxyribonuclease VII large subunit
VFTVSELTREIRRRLEHAFPEVWVEGEISNCRIWPSGILYFTLKDAGAQLKAVMFRMAVRNLRFKPADGLHVIARGQIGVYEPKGDYQLACEHLEPKGLGALQLAFEQLKQRLQKDGLFDAARKRPLPALPRKIGIVTSLEGAAIRDILKVLDRRYPTAHIVIRPARVQGEGAASDVARALRAISRVAGVDVIIVGRGGGSIEDLWAFNEEVVARAIAACTVPVISAVGHEVDTTIADFVADLRAPTPSAAAEMVVAQKEEVCNRIDRLAQRAAAAARARLLGLRTRLSRTAAQPAFAGWPARLAFRGQHVALLSHTLRRAAQIGLTERERRYQQLRLRLEALDLRHRLARLGARIAAADGRLDAAAARRRHLADRRLRTLAARLGNLSPLAVLGRGYALCWDESRRALVRSAETVRAGDTVHVTLERGELDCEVTATRATPEQEVGGRR